VARWLRGLPGAASTSQVAGTGSGTVFSFVLGAKHWFALNAQVKIGEELRPLHVSRGQSGLGGKVEQGKVVRLHLHVQVGRVPAGIHERDEDVTRAFRTGIHTLLAQHPM
jgi:hypothetical protein